jgi:hypothetical protein
MCRTYFRLGPLPDRASSSHVTDVTSGQKALLGRILRNFQLCMRRTYFRTGLLPVTWLTSLPVTWLRHFRSNGPTRVDMAQLPVAHAQNIRPDRARDWRHFRSRDFRLLLIAPPQMRLELSSYTTPIFIFFKVLYFETRFNSVMYILLGWSDGV